MVVSLELLLQGAHIELERLIAKAILGLDQLRGDVVAQSRRRAAAQAGHAGRKIELLRVAEQVAVRPRRAAAAAQVGRIGDGKSDRVGQALLHVEREWNAPLGVQLLGGARADTREHAKR